MNDALMVEMAKTVLRTFLGSGWWVTWKEKAFKKTQNPLLGLAVGDVVYDYDDESERIRERSVIAVVDGIGYVLFAIEETGEPMLLSVNADESARTIADAVRLGRENIESRIEYAEEAFANATKLKALLGQ